MQERHLLLISQHKQNHPILGIHIFQLCTHHILRALGYGTYIVSPELVVPLLEKCQRKWIGTFQVWFCGIGFHQQKNIYGFHCWWMDSTITAKQISFSLREFTAALQREQCSFYFDVGKLLAQKRFSLIHADRPELANQLQQPFLNPVYHHPFFLLSSHPPQHKKTAQICTVRAGLKALRSPARRSH